jgi:hypothetical protein
MNVSPFYYRSGHVSYINLTEMRRKADRLFLPSTEPDSRLGNVSASHFFQIRDDHLCVHLRFVSPI